MFNTKTGSEMELTQSTEESMDRNKAAFFFEHVAGQERWKSMSWLERTLQILRTIFGFGDDLITYLVSEIVPEKVKWLWDNRIPLGKLTLFVGYPDNGKSLVATYVAATVTTGQNWYDAENLLPPSEVLIFADEDDARDTIRPRLEASGADLKRVRLGRMSRKGSDETVHESQMCLEKDIAAIEGLLDANPKIKLVVIDPLSNHLGAKDMNKEQEVRRVLTPLQKVAADRSVAVLGIMHLNKKEGLGVINRVGGAMAFVGVARAVWLFVADKQDQALFHMLRVKKNVGRRVGGLKYKIATWDVDINGEAVEQPRVEWIGGSHQSADELMEPGPRGRPREERNEATLWLKQFLADGPKPSTEVEAQCNKAGFSYRTLERAKDEPNSPFEVVRANGRWQWQFRN